MKIKNTLKHFSFPSGEALSLILVQVFFWMSWGWGSYMSVYLQEQGVTASQLGILNAAVAAVSIFSAFFWGVVSDRINSIKKTFLFTMCSGAVLMALFPLIPSRLSCSVLLFILGACLICFPRSASSVLMENFTVRICSKQRYHFGFVRSFGSFAFSVGSSVIAILVSVAGIASSFWFSGLLLIPCLFLIRHLQDPVADAPVKKRRVNPFELFKSYRYTVLIIFCVMLNICTNGEFAFFSYLMEDKGIPIEYFGIILTFRALIEPFVLMFSHRLLRRFRMQHILVAAALFMGLECFVLSLWAETFVQLILTVMIFGIGNGLYICSLSPYIYQLAPDHLKASAQSVFAAGCSVAGILGNILGGFLFESLGSSRYYFAVGGAFVFSALFFLLANRAGKNLPDFPDVRSA